MSHDVEMQIFFFSSVSITMNKRTHIPLHRVPGIRDFGVLFVGLDGCHHLRVHPLIHLRSKDVAQDPTDQHDDEDDEEDDKEDQEHASDLPVSAQCSQEGDDGDNETGSDQDGSRGDVEIAAQQSLHERLVGQGPDADREHDQAARLGTTAVRHEENKNITWEEVSEIGQKVKEMGC